MSKKIKELSLKEMSITGAYLGSLVTKICPDPGCSAVWHNCPKKHTRCNDCGGNIMAINAETFWEKFALEWFQYDFKSGELFRPVSSMKSVDVELPKLDVPVWALCEKADGSQCIKKIRRINMPELFSKWQWSGVNIKSYFTLKVTDWILCDVVF